jgi:predicted RNase H-like HicB family nuclease
MVFMNQTYPIEIFYSKKDAGYIATFPDLPGCSAFGETEKDALSAAQKAKEAWIAAQNAAGNPIPLPAETHKFSGKFLVRVPKDLHAHLSHAAQRQGVSLNQYVLYRLAQ